MFRVIRPKDLIQCDLDSIGKKDVLYTEEFFIIKPTLETLKFTNRTWYLLCGLSSVYLIILWAVRGLSPPAKVAVLAFWGAALPYVLISFYDRYEVPLGIAKFLLVYFTATETGKLFCRKKVPS